MNIPARYCAGYLSDIGLPPPYAPMDFTGWFEADLDGAWHAFDPRNNAPHRADPDRARPRRGGCADQHTFGADTLVSFKAWTDEVPL